MKNCLTLALILIGIFNANAQEENAKNIIYPNLNYSQLYAGLEASTTSSINTDTKDSNGVSVYLSPYIDYYHKIGVGIKLQTYALIGGSDPGFYITSISPYFAKYNGKVLPYISYSRYILHHNPAVPYSPIQNELYAHLRLRTKYIEPRAGLDIGFGDDDENNNKTVWDINAFAGLAYTFIKENISPNISSAFAVRPSLQINAGTDRYYKFLRTSGYISRNTKAGRTGYGRGRRNNSPGGNQAIGSTYIISAENSFAISNLEVNLHVMYFIGQFSIEPSGSLYFPFRGEDRTAYGYWQINLNYWIK